MRADVAAGQSFTDEVVAASSGTFDRWLLGRIQRPLATAPIRFRLWDGYELSPPADPPIATIEIKNRRALIGWARDPELNFGEAYMFGAVEVHGDLEGMLEAVYRAFGPSTRRAWWQRQMAHTIEASRARTSTTTTTSATTSTGSGSTSEMVYTCAYFPTPDATLEAAQIAKMDLVCRKLRLSAGRARRRGRLRMGRAGAAHGAALRRHASARSTSRPSRSPSRGSARAREGLADRVEFVEDDYRNIAGTCDAFVSVGMLEHVGLAELRRSRPRDRPRAGRRRPRPAALHRPQPARAAERWIRGASSRAPIRRRCARCATACSSRRTLSVLDVENLRLHYAKTLEHWRQRFDGVVPTSVRGDVRTRRSCARGGSISPARRPRS